jgi:lipopolysaccharide heptosyltransferase I
LIIRLSAIGDVVRVLPALHCLHDTYPNAQIDWVVEGKSADVLEGHLLIDQLLVFDRSDDLKQSIRSFWELCKRVRANRYDMVIDFHGILKSGLITGFSGAAERFGFSRPRSQELSYLFTNRKTRLGMEVKNRMHENLALCESFSKGSKSLDVTLHIPEEALDMSEAFMEENFAGSKKIAALHIPVDRPEKQWPLPHFAALTDMLLSDGRFEVLLTWGPGQLDIVREVAAMTSRNPVIAPETHSLKQYMALIQESDLYFGGDTGPMHIASALDIPVVSVFGDTEPEQHATLRQPCKVLHASEFVSDSAVLSAMSAAEMLSCITPEIAYDACVSLAFGKT